MAITIADVFQDGVCVFFVALLFFLLNKVVRESCTSLGSEEGDWVWRNTVVSLIHAVVSGVVTTTFLGIPSDELFDRKETLASRWITIFCCGYAAYDFFDYLWQPNRKNDISTVGIIIHHLLTVFTLFLGISYRVTLYMARGLMVEVNSLFLHIRRLLRLSNVSLESTTYQVNNMFLFVTCIFFRFGLGFNVWYALYYSGKVFPLWAAIWCATVILFFFILSVYMIERIYHNDYRKRRLALNNNLVNGHKSSVLLN